MEIELSATFYYKTTHNLYEWTCTVNACNCKILTKFNIYHAMTYFFFILVTLNSNIKEHYGLLFGFLILFVEHNALHCNLHMMVLDMREREREMTISFTLEPINQLFEMTHRNQYQLECIKCCVSTISGAKNGYLVRKWFCERNSCSFPVCYFRSLFSDNQIILKQP